jgi:hypothetical protein
MSYWENPPRSEPITHEEMRDLLEELKEREPHTFEPFVYIVSPDQYEWFKSELAQGRRWL